MKNRLVSAIVLLCCLLSLASCGADTGKPTESTDTQASSRVQIENADDAEQNETAAYSGESTSEVKSGQADGPDSSLGKSENLGQAATLPANSTFSIQFIDVGQADSALVECDGHYMLIDGGNKADSNLVYSVLKKNNVKHLDIVVGTHAHEDHIGGIPGAFNYADADLTLCATKSYDSEAFKDFKNYADKKGGGITVPAVGDSYSIGSASIKILGVNGDSDTNNTSIVLMLTYGKTKFLFTGDAEREAEQVILNSGADLSATVLKVGHHGSDTSTSYPFLREIMPQYAVISVGTGNSYGHPTEDTLSRLRDADVKVYRTDLQGDIKCTSDGKAVSFSVSKNASANTLAPTSTTNSTTKSNTESTVTQPTASKTVSIPAGTTYVLNTSSKKFHSPDCGSVGKISEANRTYSTSSAEDLVSQGYTPCSSCKPYVIPTTAPEPESTQTQTQTETLVWIPQSGAKYHSKSSCSNMRSPTQVTKSQAEARGYTPCKKCW